jgi:hypothetical protein
MQTMRNADPAGAGGWPRDPLLPELPAINRRSKRLEKFPYAFLKNFRFFASRIQKKPRP